jgi:hypothetical protein
MKNQSLQHDHAFALATAILEMVAPCLRGEEQRDAFDMFYEAAKAGFQHYEEQADRRQQRLGPSAN